MGRLDSVATLWSKRFTARFVNFTSLRFAVLIRVRKNPQIVGPHHFPSRLLPNGVLDPDLLLVSILLRRRQLRSGFVVIGRS